MNERIQHLAILCTEECGDYHIGSNPQFNYEKFAELIVRECVNTLEFHGYDDAVPYVKWMATNKLGMKND